jgi:hypothetical protein
MVAIKGLETTCFMTFPLSSTFVPSSVITQQEGPFQMMTHEYRKSWSVEFEKVNVFPS